MTTGDNREKIERLYHDGFLQLDMAAVDEVVHPEFTYHGALPIGPGIDGLKAYIRSLSDLMHNPEADAGVDILQFISEGDKSASVIRVIGNHVTEVLGAPATGNRVDVMVVCMYRFQDGKLIEEWSGYEEVKLMSQLGLMTGSTAVADTVG